MTPFIWIFASPKDRAEFIRSSHDNLNPERLCDLFGLTEKGLEAVLNGEDWSTEFTIEEYTE